MIPNTSPNSSLNPGPYYAGRQRVAHVPDALANVIPDVRNLPGGGLLFQVDKDRRATRAREAAHKIETRRFLQRALQPIGNLQQGVIQGRTGPGRLHDHRLDDERRILVPPETVEGAQPGDRRRDHHIDDERAVLERPLRQVELHLRG